MSEQNEDAVYQYTDYEYRVWRNYIFVTILLLVVLVLIFFVISSVVNITIVNSLQDVILKHVNISNAEMKDFLKDLISRDVLSEKSSERCRELLAKEYQVFVDDNFRSFLHVIVRLLAYSIAVVIVSVMLLFIRSNFDTMLMELGTIQKKITIAGLQENLILQQKRARARGEVEKTKEDLKLEREKLSIEIRKQREMLRLRRKKDKLGS